jgi:chromosome segregation ATPase
MAGRPGQFSAKDAFLYTDTYRKAVKMNASTIAHEKERLKERYRHTGGSDSSYYAELRGLEHAMNYVVKNEEPKLVILGEADGSKKEPEVDKEAQLTARLAEMQRKVSAEKESKEKLKKDLKSVGEAYKRLQAEAIELRQTAMRLQRRMAQSTSTFGVVVFALTVVIVVLLVVANK